MREMKVSKKIYRDNNVQTLETRYIGGSIDSQWVYARPELLKPDIKEWFIHYILRKHFSYGQPFCIVCGRAELLTNK